jgi:predicted adenylyl cyclase CyaB
MAKKNLEIEVKVLLGKKENADNLLERLKSNDSEVNLLEKSSQLNHYYLPGDFQKLKEFVNQYLDDSQKEYFEEIVFKGSNHSIRSRWINDKVLLVLKAGRNKEEQGANGSNRMEIEVEVPLSIEELDSLIMKADFMPQSKWSRQREEYKYKGMHVCIDKNAGYGYVAEFERVVPKTADADKVRQGILNVISELGLEELDAARLDRMFSYYNSHWSEYYGTENTFTLE